MRKLNPRKQVLTGDRRRGFTLVELLVVIAIIGILIGMLLPAVQAVREAARRIQCANNSKQISLALLNFESAHKKFPAGRHGLENNGHGAHANDPDIGSDSTSFLVTILPYMEASNISDQLEVRELQLLSHAGDWNVSDSSPENVTALALFQTSLPMYNCPSDEKEETVIINVDGNMGETELATGSYAGSVGVGFWGGTYVGIGSVNGTEVKYRNNGMLLYANQVAMGEVTDGTSSTFIVGETIMGHFKKTDDDDALDGQFNAWAFNRRYCSTNRSTDTPLNWPIGVRGNSTLWGGTNGSFASNHTGGANFAYVDGHVGFVSENVDFNVYQNISTRNGGETDTNL